MDELQISGKRYISSRRVAKENGYHTDYIGQLIRGNKIKGQKVGRTWYVEANSFAVYLGQEIPSAVASVAPMQPTTAEYGASPAVEAPEVASPSLSKPSAVVVASTPVPAPVIEKIIEKPEVQQPAAVAAAPVEVQEEETFTVPLRRMGTTPASAAAAGGLRYVADDGPLIPEISRAGSVTRVMPRLDGEENVRIEEHAPIAAFEARAPRAWRTAAILAGAGVTVFIFSAVVSSGLLQTINIEAGNPASVSYSLNW